MPQELVDMVVNEILRPARTAVYKYWDELFACAKERCRYRDHFSEEEKEELRPEMEDIWRQGAAEGADFSLDDVLLEHLDSCGSDSVYGLHLDLSRVSGSKPFHMVTISGLKRANSNITRAILTSTKKFLIRTLG